MKVDLKTSRDSGLIYLGVPQLPFEVDIAIGAGGRATT
mgnify:CR=1 FL=1